MACIFSDKEVRPYISVGGKAPVGPDGKTAGVGDPASQARRCLEIIQDFDKFGAHATEANHTRHHFREKMKYST